MNVFRFLLTGAMIVFFSSTPASAQNWYLGARIGQALLSGDSADNVDDGISLMMFGGYRLNPGVSLETTVSYSSHDDEVEDPGDYTIEILIFTFGPRFSAPLRQNIDLYAGAGFGIYTIDLSYETEGQPGNPRDETDGESGMYGCVGMIFHLKPTVHMGVDVNYHHVFEDEMLDSDIITMSISLAFDLHQ